MNEYLTFEGRVEPLEWGKSTYTILRLPDAVNQKLRNMGAKRVEGEIADYPVNLGLAKADVVDGTFLWTGKDLLRRIGISPGETVEVRLCPAPEDYVEMPANLTNALRSAGLRDTWDAMTPGKRRGLVHRVTSAKRPETQVKRIAGILDDLRQC